MVEMCEAAGQRSSFGRCPVCRTREITLVPGLVTEDDGITYNRLLMEPHIAGAGLGQPLPSQCPGSGQAPITDSTGRLACPNCLGVQPVHVRDPAIVQGHKPIRFPVSEVQAFSERLAIRKVERAQAHVAFDAAMLTLPSPGGGTWSWELTNGEIEKRKIYWLLLDGQRMLCWRSWWEMVAGLQGLDQVLAKFVGTAD